MRGARNGNPTARFAAALCVALASLAIGASAAFAGGQFLVYTGNGGFTEGYSGFAAAAGRTAVTSTTFPADLSPYGCVILSLNQTKFDTGQKSVISSYLNGGGTVIALGEYAGFQGSTPGGINTTMNDVASAVGSGMSLGFDTYDQFDQTTTNLGTSPLVAGVSNVYYAATASLGAPANQILARTASFSVPFMGAKSIGGGTFVLSGDSNPFSDLGNHAFALGTGNGQLVKNLCADRTPPTISITVPQPAARYKPGANVTPQYSCNDPDGPADVVSCTGPATLDTTGATGAVTPHTYTVTAVDSAGNQATKTVSYVVDDQAPTITLTAPANGSNVERGANVNAAWSCTDADLADRTFASATVPAGSPIATAIMGPQPFAITCTDLVGNSATPVNATYNVVDTTPPTITLTTPPDGARYRPLQAVTADWSCTDPGGGSVATQSGTTPDGGLVDTTGVSGTAAPKTFTVTCTDAFNNTAQVTHTYFIDARPPDITINVPGNGEYDRGARVPADWLCSDPDVGGGVASKTATAGVGVPIDTSTPGTKTFTVTCTDLAGNSATKSVTYTVVDRSPPVVVIAVPKDGATYAQGQKVTQAFTCLDDDGPSDLRSCDVEGGAFDTSKPGRKTFTVVGTDISGNSTKKTVTYTVSPGAAVAPSSASSRVCKSRRSFRIRVKKARGVRILSASVTVNGKRVQTKRGRRVTAVVTLKGLKKGRYKVVIRVRLSNGRTVTDVRRFRTCTPKRTS